jgi:hypothetical protein
MVEFPEGFEAACSCSSELEKVTANICNETGSRKQHLAILSFDSGNRFYMCYEWSRAMRHVL